MQEAYIKLVGNKGVEISGGDEELVQMILGAAEVLRDHGSYVAALEAGALAVQKQLDAHREDD